MEDVALAEEERAELEMLRKLAVVLCELDADGELDDYILEPGSGAPLEDAIEAVIQFYTGPE